jgi:hypothetical protein
VQYLTPIMAREAIKSMKNFHDDIVDVYDRNGMDLLDNLGRRNIVMSQAQEKFFAQVLSKSYEDVIEDGHTGQPDIVIGALNKELECKLTSRHRSGAISFQSDFETLQNKKSLDYLYVIADQLFNKFAVLHFLELTVDDFRSLSPGSRGKVAMYKHRGMKKCNVLLGDVRSLNSRHIDRLEKKLLGQCSPSERTKMLKSLKYWKEVDEKYEISLEEV